MVRIAKLVRFGIAAILVIPVSATIRITNTMKDNERHRGTTRARQQHHHQRPTAQKHGNVQ
eukprot:2594752-Lingulodinium_polyedra.AAC.1